MSIAQYNERHVIPLVAYNESEPVRLEGGIVSKTKGTEVTINVLYMHIPNTREVRKPNGQRFREDGFKFQISSKELTDKSFSILAGKTIIKKDGYEYRVVEVKDYTMYPLTECMQCRAVRMILIDAN